MHDQNHGWRADGDRLRIRDSVLERGMELPPRQCGCTAGGDGSPRQGMGRLRGKSELTPNKSRAMEVFLEAENHAQDYGLY